MLGVRVVPSTTRGPFRSLIAMCGHSPTILEHPRRVEQVVGHERRVAVREVVVDSDAIVSV